MELDRDPEREYIDRSGENLDENERKVDEIVALLVAGILTPLMFDAIMRQLIEDTLIEQYAIGRGLDSGEELGEGELEMLNAILAFQFDKLAGFIQDIIDGELTPGQIAARAKMYIGSTRQGFERGRGRRLGWPELPAYAGDGSTVCLTRCRCHWEGRKLVDRWHFFWVLDYLAEHCTSPDVDAEGRPRGCLERGAFWNPLVVMEN